jgi:hypothetical protein
MKILPEKEEFLMNSVRNAIAVNPLVSVRRMQEIVEKNTGRLLSDKYTAKLMKKLRRRAIIESDRKQVNERLSEVRERFRVLTDDLMRIIYWTPEIAKIYGQPCPSFKERIAAMKLLAQLDLAIFKAELDIGMFKNGQTGVSYLLRQGVAPTEMQEQLTKASRTWKLTPVGQEVGDNKNSA